MFSFACPTCGEGRAQFSEVHTFESYATPIVFTLDDLPKLKEGILNDVLIFVCYNCQSEFRLTFKEFEKKLRKELTKKYINYFMGQGAKNPNITVASDRVFIYCGKCNGFDGKGACPFFVYSTCEIKRLPICD